MVKTTVIIPNYNGKEYLWECLSFLKRSYVYDPAFQGNELLRERHIFDTIVVDNGSTDGSLELLRTEFPKVKVIALSENTGFSKAVNAGIKAAKTPYVFLLNNDTRIDGLCVSKLERAMDEHPKYFSIGAKMLSMKEPEIIDDAGDMYCALGWAYALGKGANASFYEKDYDVFAACAGAAIYRREVFDQIGLFDGNHFAYLEDIDVGWRALLNGYKNGFLHDAIVYHAGSGSSGSRYNEFKVKLSSRNSTYIIRKNMPPLQRLLNLPFFIVGFFVKWLFFVKKGFGALYIKGLFEGIALSMSAHGKKKKVHFKWRNFGNYCKVQWILWINVIRRVIG